MKRVSLEYETEVDKPAIYLGDYDKKNNKDEGDVFKVIQDLTWNLDSFKSGDIICCSIYEPIGCFNEDQLFTTRPEHVLATIIEEKTMEEK